MNRQQFVHVCDFYLGKGFVFAEALGDYGDSVTWCFMCNVGPAMMS